MTVTTYHAVQQSSSVYDAPPDHDSAAPARANVLQGVALLGMMSATVIQRLWLPDRSIDRARALLRNYAADGLITDRYIHGRARRCHPPVRRGHWWALTKVGLDLARTLTGEELTTTGMRTGVEVHDGMVVDTVTALISQARQHRLSSVVVQREAHLLEHARKPTADALVLVRQHPEATPRTDHVPWSVGKAVRGETATRLWVEADNHTEDVADIVGKALVYQQTTETYRAAGRPMPLVAWVAPTEKRRDWISRLWQQAWPQGTWLLATTDEVQQGTWWQYAQGSVQAVSLFG